MSCCLLRCSLCWHSLRPHHCCLWGVFLFFPFFKNVYLNLDTHTHTPHTQNVSGGGAERGRHRVGSRLQALSCQPRARHGACTHEPQDHDLSRSRTLNPLSPPGAPLWGVFQAAETWSVSLDAFLILLAGSKERFLVLKWFVD